MNIWSRIPLWFVILAVGIAVIAIMVSMRPTPQPMPPAEPEVPQVNVVPVQSQPKALNVTSQGTVAPRRELDIVSQVSGQIVAVETDFVDGGFFSKDQTLITIDSRDYEFALANARATLADAEQALAMEQGQARQAKREWRDLGNTQANDLFLRKPQIKAAKARLEAAKASVKKAQLDLERTRITVPFTGRIRDTHVDLGQFVTSGTRVATVYDTSVAEIRLPLTDRQSALVNLPLGFRADSENKGPEVLITGVVGTKEYTWKGRITRTDASIDTQSRMYFAVAEVEDPFVQTEGASQPPLIVGLFVEAEISGRQLDDVIQLPLTAVFQRDRVYIVDQEDKISMKTVNVLYKNDEYVWINGDALDGEDFVVVDRQKYVLPGVQVVSQIQDGFKQVADNRLVTE